MDPGIFVGGGGGGGGGGVRGGRVQVHLSKKISDYGFVSFFLKSSTYSTECQWFISLYFTFCKLYMTCHLLITFANSLDPDQAQHSVQARSGSKLFETL